MGGSIGSAPRPNGRVTELRFESLTAGRERWFRDSWIVMFTIAVQVGPNGSRDLPIHSPKSQCVPSNSQRPAYEAALRQRETWVRPTESALGSHEQHEPERFAPRAFALPEHGFHTEA